MTVWVDTHCHLDSLEEVGAVLGRSRSAGVQAVVTVGCDLESSRRAVDIASLHDEVWAAVGVHPHDAVTLTEESLDALRGLASGPRVVAVGEIGLDYYRDLSPREVQREAFRRQIETARLLGRPVVVHMRDAHDDVFSMLSEGGPPARLVFHCFSGGPQEAKRALDLGGHLSFAGNISYRDAGELREAARVVPLDRLLVETDSPYLAPVPHRGRRNEPAFVGAVGAALAEAIRRPVEEVAEATTLNARLVFGLPG